jgi:hypothetical protein
MRNEEQLINLCDTCPLGGQKLALAIGRHVMCMRQIAIPPDEAYISSLGHVKAQAGCALPPDAYESAVETQDSGRLVWQP